jgi:CCR4-NOT transcription complex subunit 7/8
MQAGSDSLLTSATFLRLARTFFDGVAGVRAHCGVLYGLGTDGTNEMLGTD